MDLHEPLSVYYQKSLDHARQCQLEAAYENMSHAIQLAPDCAEFYFYRGQFSWQLDCLEGALTNMNKPIGLKVMKPRLCRSSKNTIGIETGERRNTGLPPSNRSGDICRMFYEAGLDLYIKCEYSHALYNEIGRLFVYLK